MERDFPLDKMTAKGIFEKRNGVFERTRQHLQQLRNLSLEALAGIGEELVTFRQEPGQVVALQTRSLSLDNPGLSDFIIRTSSGPKPQAETVYLSWRGIPDTLVLPREGQPYFISQPIEDAIRSQGEGLISKEEIPEEDLAALLRCLSECKSRNGKNNQKTQEE